MPPESLSVTLLRHLHECQSELPILEHHLQPPPRLLRLSHRVHLVQQEGGGQLGNLTGAAFVHATVQLLVYVLEIWDTPRVNPGALRPSGVTFVLDEDKAADTRIRLGRTGECWEDFEDVCAWLDCGFRYLDAICSDVGQI